MPQLEVRIVTPRAILLQTEAEGVQAPGEIGEFGVLPGHIPFVTTLKPGVVVVHGAGGVAGVTRRFNVGVGFVEAGPDRVTVLVETCEEVLGSATAAH
ncbi:MAG: F0F1 ATP synthase subunit epsilon [Myxococcales bacterium]|nr:F0F1 ATP synthase subunit epsilon [Myxococcales bacterium]